MPDPVNPQALNRYSYVINNPVKYIDPSGHFWKSIKKLWKGVKKVVKKIVGVVLVTVGAVLTADANPFGPYLMAAGFALLGANVNVSASTQVGSFGGGGGGPGGLRFEYTGPGSGNRGGYRNPRSYMGSGGGGDGGLHYANTGGIDLYVNFINRYSDYKQPTMDSVNRNMMPDDDGNRSMRRMPWLEYDDYGNIIGEIGIEKDPLIDPTAIGPRIATKLTKGIGLISQSALLRSTSRGLKRMLDSLRVRPNLRLRDARPFDETSPSNIGKLIFQPSRAEEDKRE